MDQEQTSSTTPEVIQPLNQPPADSKVDPETEKSPEKPAQPNSRWQRFHGWYGGHKKLSIPLTILLLLVVLAALPLTRYRATGLLVKKNFSIQILDATTHTPVSGATVATGSVSSQTNGNGQAVLHLSVGNHSLLVTKKYYKEQNITVLVPILDQKSSPGVSMTATGRQVKIVVKNLITQATIGNAGIKIAGTDAKTDSNGQAIVVVPADAATQGASLSASGYNNSAVTVKVSNSTIAENDFSLTPVGKIYFMSKRTGKLDMMKSNLDGTEPQVVVAGTGNEHDYDTVLSASPDWKYVALLSRRNSTDDSPKLYILSTDDDKLLSADSNNGVFTIVGWAGDSLVYYLTRDDLPSWRSGNDKLKSYDAGTGKTTLLDQTAATGDDTDSAYEYYNLVAIDGNTVFYAKSWTENYNDEPSGILDGKNGSASIINANGQNHKLIASYDSAENVQYVQHSPSGIYIWQETVDAKDKFFDYTIGGIGPKAIKLTSDQFYDSYPTYFTSPSQQQTFWAESRDGKNTLFVGDGSGNNSSTIGTLSELDPYGWYGEKYLLATKNSSEFYIMDTKGGKAVKITDFEPAAYFRD